MPEKPETKARKQRSPFYANVFKDKTRKSKPWCLDIHIRSEGGKRRTRTFYALEREAKAAAVAAREGNVKTGLASADISTALSTEAIKAAAILNGRGSLVEAAAYFIKHAYPIGGEMKLSDAVEKYRAWQEAEGASKAYLSDMRWRLARLVRELPAGIKMPEVSWPVLAKYLGELKLKPIGRQNEIRNMRPLFNWAIDEKLIASNPIPSKALATRKKDRTQEKSIRILTLDEIQLLLEHAGDFLPHLIFGLYCGVRPDETKGLDWKDVNWAQMRVTVNNRASAMHDRRTIPIPPNALAWLQPHREATGEVSSPKHYLTLLHKAGKAAGLCEPCKIMKPGDPPKKKWPKDCLRHSFASYWLAKHDDETRLKFLMGHHWASQMLRKHYLDRGITAEQAEVYWNLVPKAPANVIQMPKKQPKSGT